MKKISKGFTPTDLSTVPAIFQLPNELWISMLEAPCQFSPDIFLQVMENLSKNPNLTSSHLFRAEVFYDSLNDVTVSEDQESEHFSSFTRHMKAEYRPLRLSVPGFDRQRTIVRRLIPRNPQLDKALVQSCHILKKRKLSGEDSEEHLVIYLPHATSAEQIPWYHPAVQSIAFLYSLEGGTKF